MTDVWADLPCETPLSGNSEDAVFGEVRRKYSEDILARKVVEDVGEAADYEEDAISEKAEGESSKRLRTMKVHDVAAQAGSESGATAVETRHASANEYRSREARIMSCQGTARDSHVGSLCFGRYGESANHHGQFRTSMMFASNGDDSGRGALCWSTDADGIAEGAGREMDSGDAAVHEAVNGTAVDVAQRCRSCMGVQVLSGVSQLLVSKSNDRSSQYNATTGRRHAIDDSAKLGGDSAGTGTKTAHTGSNCTEPPGGNSTED